MRGRFGLSKAPRQLGRSDGDVHSPRGYSDCGCKLFRTRGKINEKVDRSRTVRSAVEFRRGGVVHRLVFANLGSVPARGEPLRCLKGFISTRGPIPSLARTEWHLGLWRGLEGHREQSRLGQGLQGCTLNVRSCDLPLDWNEGISVKEVSEFQSGSRFRLNWIVLCSMRRQFHTDHKTQSDE